MCYDHTELLPDLTNRVSTKNDAVHTGQYAIPELKDVYIVHKSCYHHTELLPDLTNRVSTKNDAVHIGQYNFQELKDNS